MKKIIGVITSFLILISIGFIGKELYPLLSLLLITLLFIILDYATFELRSIKKRERSIEEDSGYHPNLRIWGLGGILGIGGVLLNTLSILKEKEMFSITGDWWQNVVFKLGVLFFILIFIGFILLAIVKIVKED